MPVTVILATGGYDQNICFWEAAVGVAQKTVEHQESQVNCLAISPDKNYLVAGGNPKIKIYESQGSRSTAHSEFEGHTSNVTAVAFQQDGQWLTSSSEDGTIKIWDLRGRGVQRSYDVGAPVSQVVLHPNQGELISSDESGAIQTWDLVADKCVAELVPAPDVAMRSVSMSMDGSLLIGANASGDVYYWIGDNGTYTLMDKLEAHKRYILKALLSPDSRYLATASADHTVKVWDVQDDFSLVHELTGHTQWVWDCVFSADSAYIVSVSSDHIVRLWDLDSGETIRQYTGHKKAVTCVALSDTS